MAKTVTITNIKNIRNLVFEIPNNPGVYVLTGSNGSGKTTLMTCLLRIGWFRAFQDHFRTGNDRVDLYRGEVVYSVNGQSVSYHHGGTRWPPTPRKNSSLFPLFGFPEVRFLPATGNRLFIQDQNISPTDFRAVEDSLKADLNELLETTKFDNLRYVQTASTRGPGSGSQRWKRAYVIKVGNNYYSERNFSLGEILILNTLLLIQDVAPGSMLLIDELEMALHPKVQVRLLNFLSRKALEKNLTVILSTHSSSLIKSAKRLIYLENRKGDGDIKVRMNCYPALVLRDVAIEEDIQPDYVFVVEDAMAEMLLKETIKHYSQLTPDRLMPIYKVLPIGGYPQVLSFANNSSNYLFNSKIGLYIFPDADVVEAKRSLAAKGNNRNPSEQELFELFGRLDTITKFLPISPELGLWNWLTTETVNIQQRLTEHYADVTFSLDDLIASTNQEFPNPAENPRKGAKRKLEYLASLLETRTNEDARRVNQFLFGLFVRWYYALGTNTATLRGDMGSDI